MKYNCQNTAEERENIDFSQAKFSPVVEKLQNHTRDIISNIIAEQRLVLYKNSSWKMFYIFFSIDKNTWKFVISRITSVKWYFVVSKKEQNQIMKDVENGTNVSWMIPVKNTEYKSALNKIVESFHKEKEVKAFSGTFGYTSTKWAIIQVEVEAGKILSARSEWKEVSIQQKAAIQKMIFMNRFEKFVNIKLQAANDEVYFEDQENIIQAQTQTSQKIEDILDTTPKMYQEAKWQKETFSKTKVSQKPQENWEKEAKTESKQALNPELIEYYNKIKMTQKYVQIFEERYFNKNIIASKKENISKEQIFAVVNFLEFIATEFQIDFDKKIFLDKKLSRKFFIKLFSLFHPDKELHPQAKIVKKQLMQVIQCIQEDILVAENIRNLFPQKTAPWYKSTQQNSGNFSARA